MKLVSILFYFKKFPNFRYPSKQNTLKALLLHQPSTVVEDILIKVQSVFPQISFTAITSSLSQAQILIRQYKPDIFFYNIDQSSKHTQKFLDQLDAEKQSTILISENELSPAHKYSSVIGFLAKPILTSDLYFTVKSAMDQIQWKNSNLLDKNNVSFPKDVIGVPTMRGFEYLKVKEIFRCEGLQKCTRIVTKNRKDIVSSYSLGAFSDLLIPHSFYLVHRSHLINLNKVVRYSRDGFIYLSDGSSVPLARRKKADFLDSWQHI